MFSGPFDVFYIVFAGVRLHLSIIGISCTIFCGQDFAKYNLKHVHFSLFQGRSFYTLYVDQEIHYHQQKKKKQITAGKKNKKNKYREKKITRNQF
jgi:hypothetical protein